MSHSNRRRGGYFCLSLTPMPQPGIELTSIQLHLFWGTLTQDALPAVLFFCTSYNFKTWLAYFWVVNPWPFRLTFGRKMGTLPGRSMLLFGLDTEIPGWGSPKIKFHGPCSPRWLWVARVGLGCCSRLEICSGLGPCSRLGLYRV